MRARLTSVATNARFVLLVRGRWSTDARTAAANWCVARHGKSQNEIKIEQVELGVGKEMSDS
jgi:hypothetical protein